MIPLVWDQRGRKKERKMDIRVNIDLPSLPGPLVGPGYKCRGGGEEGRRGVPLVRILLLGPTALSCCANLFPFGRLYIGC